MSKDLKIKGALSKDFQQIYIDDEPTGLFINNEGKIKIKDLVVSDKSALSNENLEIKRGSDYFTSSAVDPTTAITNSGDMVLDVNGDLFLETDGGQFFLKKTNLYSAVFEIDTENREIKFVDAAQAANLFKIAVDANGETTLSTIDWDATVGHLKLVPDGDLILDPATQKTIINATDGLYFDGGTHTYIAESSDDVLDFNVGFDKMLTLDEANDRVVIGASNWRACTVSGQTQTEFSASNSAYAGMILGYTHLLPNSITTVALTTSYAVVDADAKVTFVAPPSGNVEVEAYFYRDSVSLSKTLHVGLSDNATYNQASAQTGDGSTTWDMCFEYGFDTTDETDDKTIVAKFVVGGLTAGSSYTYWLGAKTSATTTNIVYGGRTLTDPDRYYPPIIMKATALPASIHTDS